MVRPLDTWMMGAVGVWGSMLKSERACVIGQFARCGDRRRYIDMTRSKVDGVMDRHGWKTPIAFAKTIGGL